MDEGTSAILDYSVVVPVYRGRATIEELCSRIARFFEHRGDTFEIILVDDGSSDGSWDKIVEIARADPRVLGIQLMRNFGQHNATACGFRHAGGQFVVTLDEDLQNPPEEIGKMIAAMERSNADVIYGTPESKQHNWWRRLSSRIVRLVIGVNADVTSVRLIRSRSIEPIVKSDRPDIVIDVYLSWATKAIAATPVRHDVAARPSSYSVATLVGLMFSLIFNYTVIPLRLAIVGGAVLSAMSFVLGAVMAYLRMVDRIDVPGFTAIIVSILFSTGLILVGIGVMSEYLARIFLHSNHKPQSIIRWTTKEMLAGRA